MARPENASADDNIFDGAIEREFGITESWKIFVRLGNAYSAIANHANPNPNNVDPISGLPLDCPPGAQLINVTPFGGSNERYYRVTSGGVTYNFKSWILIRNNAAVAKAAHLRLAFTGFPAQAATFIFTSEGNASPDAYTHRDTISLNSANGTVFSALIPVPKNTCDPANLPPGILPCTRGR